jgi:uncharacterized membrane protein
MASSRTIAIEIVRRKLALLGQPVKFLTVGGSGVFVDMGVFVTALRLLNMHLIAASTASFLVAVTWNFHWNRRWTFLGVRSHRAWLAYIQFVTVALIALCVRFAVLDLAVTSFHMPPEFAQLVAIVVATGVNFAGCKFWVFKDDTLSVTSCGWMVSLLVVAVLVGLALRTYRISAESLWLDEAESFRFASGSLEVALAAEKTNPPLYYVLLHFWIKVFGSSEAALRSLSVIPGVLSILLTAFLGTRLFDRRVGAIAACFLAISTFHIGFSQEARCFALLLSLLLASMLAMDSALRQDTPRIAPWLIYIAATLAALYTHFYAVFFVASQNAIVVVFWRDYRKKLWIWAATQLVLLAAFSPWMLTMLHAAGGGGQLHRYLLAKVPQAVFSFVFGETLIPMNESAVLNIRTTLASGWPVVVLSLCSFCVLMLSGFRAARYYWRGFVFAVIMAVGPILLALIVSFKVPLLDRRYLIAASPPLYFILASGAVYTWFTGSRVARFVVTGSALAVVGLAMLSTWQYYHDPRFGREQWREVVSYIEARADTHDLVVFHVGYLIHPYKYYEDRLDSPKRLDHLSLAERFPDVASGEYSSARETLSKHDRIWLIRSHLTGVGSSEAVLRLLQEEFPSLESTEFFPKAKGIEVRLMHR